MNNILLVFISILLAGCCMHHDRNAKYPNIILIMADDLGYGGIGCYGNQEIRTPNLDKLANEGLRLTDFHSNGSVCSPTRAALLTGQYQQRVGMEGVIYVRGETREVGLDTTTATIARVMQGHGYSTGIFGKWHLGYKIECNPVYHGFDEFVGYTSGNIDYHTHYDNAGIYDWYQNLDTILEDGYVTDLITQHSISFIKKNINRPFFLYVSHEAPHVPFQGRNDPGFRYPGVEFSYHGPVEDKHRAYREMVEIMDEGIGSILQTLEETNLTDNTMVIFISDNGGLEGYGDNGSLRGAKTTLWEGGHRVPAIIYWPGKIEKNISDALVMSFDFFPTILSVCNIDPPDGHFLDGMDISPLLFNSRLPDSRYLFWRYRNQWAMRSDKWKLIITNQDTLLFDLSVDMGETRDIASEKQDILNSLIPELTSWNSRMDVYPQKTR